MKILPCDTWGKTKTIFAFSFCKSYCQNYNYGSLWGPYKLKVAGYQNIVHWYHSLHIPTNHIPFTALLLQYVLV